MVLGENALAVSRYSRHVDEAIALVRYLSRRDVQLRRSRLTSLPPTIPDLYDDPEVVAANSYYTPLKQVFLGGALSRPSSVTGPKYAQVSRAYFRAVHSVLTRQQKPAAAAAALERELVWLTGFPVAPAR
jgi:trehalose/maltose transport system substrate-binding protein